MFVGRVVVDDGVDRHSHRHLRLGGVEEADELLVPVALHVAADDGAAEPIEGGKQRRCAMAFVVVGHRPSSALLHRQTGLGAVERLDLALLINREGDGVGGRIDIETDDVPPAAAPRPDRPPAERCWAAAGAYQACASCRATALRRPPP